VSAGDGALDVSRRTALVTVCGAAAVWWLSLFPGSTADHRAIERVVANIPFEDARYTCVDAAGVCSTLYSQVRDSECNPSSMRDYFNYYSTVWRAMRLTINCFDEPFK
jgi:hypothetical protein